MALNPNTCVDGVMNGFSLHIEPPSYQKTISTNELTTLELPSMDIWFREGSSGSVVECMTGDRGAAGLSLTRETVLSP